jgi:hypothetical protein
MAFSCWKCGAKIEYPSGSRVLRADACPQCDSDLHCCRNCQFYDPGKQNQCAETQAEWVGDKETANYCGYFRPNPTLLVGNSRRASQADDAKKRFDSLFKV